MSHPPDESSGWLSALLGAGSGPVEPVLTRSGASLVFGDEMVIKIHREGTDAELLAVRLDAVLAAPELWVPPLRDRVITDPVGRAVTVWPRVAVVDPDREAPWSEAGALLTGLHRRSTAGLRLPAHDPAVRLTRARRRLAPTPYASNLGAVGDHLLAELAEIAALPTTTTPTLLHGDWHLGQLGRTGDGWRLLDIDDLAIGDPVWDLARPAGWWAAGLLPDEDWHAFRGEPAPWSRLDLPARCAVFLTACRVADDPVGSPDADVAACLQICLQW